MPQKLGAQKFQPPPMNYNYAKDVQSSDNEGDQASDTLMFDSQSNSNYHH